MKSNVLHCNNLYRSLNEIDLICILVYVNAQIANKFRTRDDVHTRNTKM